MRPRFFSCAFLLLTATLLGSCTDVIDVNLPDAEPQLVVEGYVTDQPGPYTVRLTTTAGYFNDQPAPAVRGAAISLTDADAGTTETLRETEPGVYQTSQLRGQIGHHYTLTVKAEGEQYEARTEIRRIPEIDSLRQDHKVGAPDWPDGYYVQLFATEPVGVGDYYRFKTYQNDTLQNKPWDLIGTSDEMVDGKYIGGIEVHNRPMRVGDVVRVEMLSLPQDYFYFLSEMYTQINNVGLFSSPPANVRTNVRNLNPNGRKAVGYFAGTAVRTATITIRP